IEEFGQRVPQEGHRILEKVRAGTLRMNQLIDGLLRLARFSRQPLNTRRVQTGALVTQVTANFRDQLDGRSVQMLVGDLPDCLGDAALLEQVFTNLTSNALKFTAGRAETRIEIGSQRVDSEVAYFVKDNGVGFDMRYADRLFGVFQR